MEEFNCPLFLPNERGYYRGQPPRLNKWQYNPELTMERGWCWVSPSQPQEHLSSGEVADECVSRFLRLIDLVASGKLQPPRPFYRHE